MTFLNINNLIKKTVRLIIPIIATIIIIISIISCASRPHLTGFDLQESMRDEFDTTPKPIYLTGTKPIDSADVNKLLFDIMRIETNDYPNEIRAFAKVYDSSGNFITNMANPYKKDKNAKYFTTVSEWLGKIYNRRYSSVDSFTVREYGAGDSIPYNIVLSVDYSGSMTAIFDAIFQGTEIFVDLKYPYDKIALTSFNKDFNVIVPFSSDSNQILKQYRAKRNEGTGLYSAVFDAVWKGMDLFDNTSEGEPRVLVVFSDGDDNYSKDKISNIIKKASNKKINIFTIAFGYSKDENLRELAKYTGGKFYKAYTKEELIKVFRDIYMSLRFHYLISYKPPKFWGHHDVVATVNVPNRKDTLKGYGEYDMQGIIDIGDVFERPILFDFDKDTVKEQSYYIIDEIVDLMMQDPNLRMEIQGHTDSVGTVEYNQALSERRAMAVYTEIVKRGIDSHRLRWRGFGRSQPKVPNSSEENRAINRRTEFHILSY